MGTESIAANPNSNIVELAQSSSDLSTLVTALAAANLVSALEGAGPFTVFAPSNTAFGKIPSAELGRLLEPENVEELADILKYHVVSGAAVYSKDLQAAQDVETLQGQDVSITSSADGVIINGNSKVISADNAATNGVVHVIDTVLMPQSLETTTEAIAANSNSNIVELAQSSSDLSTLVTSLAAANLVSALEGAGPFTVFAPSNAAFGKIPSAELGRLLEPENVEELADILKYHVVSGAAVYSTDLQPTQDVETLQGQAVSITSSADGVTINGNSEVISADNAASNGVVHIIDTVLMPPQ